MTSQMWRRLAPAAILLLGLALFLLFGLERYFSFEMLSRHHATLAAWVADNTMLAVVMFVLVYALVVAFSLPIAIIITPLGGFLFGVWLGAILSVIGATLGSVAVFLAARTAFYDLFHARAGAALARFEDGFRRDPGDVDRHHPGGVRLCRRRGELRPAVRPRRGAEPRHHLRMAHPAAPARPCRPGAGAGALHASAPRQGVVR